jgi:hypothetical protein
VGWFEAIVPDLINAFTGKLAVGVEIGVAKGKISKKVLDKCNIRHLFMVDPWQHGYSNTDDQNDVAQDIMETRYANVCKLIEQYPGKATIIRDYSANAAKVVPNDLDFIFIDGNHEYEYVYLDLESWVPKMKPGALIIGDDWGWVDVINAVINFSKKHNCFLDPFTEQLNLTYPHCPCPANDPVVNKISGVWWTIMKDDFDVFQNRV